MQSLCIYFLGSHCINPPTPGSQYNLKINWNYNNPPAHNEAVRYDCDAGNLWNRLETDFDKTSFWLKCLPNNQFESANWPTCKNGET